MRKTRGGPWFSTGDMDPQCQEMAEAKNDKAEAESSRESTLSELDELFEVGMMGYDGMMG